MKILVLVLILYIVLVVLIYCITLLSRKERFWVLSRTRWGRTYIRRVVSKAGQEQALQLVKETVTQRLERIDNLLKPFKPTNAAYVEDATRSIESLCVNCLAAFEGFPVHEELRSWIRRQIESAIARHPEMVGYSRMGETTYETGEMENPIYQSFRQLLSRL